MFDTFDNEEEIGYKFENTLEITKPLKENEKETFNQQERDIMVKLPNKQYIINNKR